VKLYHGQRIVNIYTNNETNNKKKETTIMEKLQTFEAPDVIMSIRDKAAEFVANWYAKHSGKKLNTQTQEKESIPPAPPCIMQEEE